MGSLHSPFLISFAMALSMRKLIDGIKIDLNVYSDDHKLANLDEYIADKVHSIRATLIREEYNQKRRIDQQYYQLTNCHEIECLKTTCTISGIEIESPNKIYKIALSSPLMTGVDEKNILYCGKDGFSEEFGRLTLFQLTSLGGRRWGKERTRYLQIGNEIYLFDLQDESLKFISTLALFYNPIEVCGWDSEDPYPCPSDYKLQLLVKKDILETWNVPYDNLNDANTILVTPKVAPAGKSSEQEQE